MLRQALKVIRCSPSFIRCGQFSTSGAFNPYDVGDDSKWLPSAPIIKNICLGHFNNEIFDFPEIEPGEEQDDFNKMSQSVERFMTTEVDSMLIDKEAKIPLQTIEAMKRLGLFGLQIPQEYGGLGLNSLKRARILEHIGIDGSISTMLLGHEALGVQTFLSAANEKQKEKYLPRLASGDSIVAFCLTEPESGSDSQAIQTAAVLSDDGTHFCINGIKTWVTNGDIADVMVVFAKTKVVDAKGEPIDRITAFIVERAFGGVHNGDFDDKLGCRGCSTCSVRFENSQVPVENVIGEVGQGFQLAMDVFDSARLSIAVGGAGMIKHLLKHTVDFALTHNQDNQPIADFQLVKQKIAEIATSVYVIESMSYLTAGLMDRIEYGDFSLEIAATKIFSSEAVWNAVSNCLQIFGALGCVKEYPYERFLRDAKILSVHGSTNDILRVLIGGSSMKHVALKYGSEELVKISQPRKNVLYNMRRTKKMWNCRLQSVDQQLQFLADAHFAPIMDELSKHTNHFRYIVPEILAKYGRNVIEEQMVLRRLVDNAIDIYAVCATVSRATCAMWRNDKGAAHERDLTYAFAKVALDRIHLRNMRVSFMETAEGIPQNVRIADALMKHGGYCAEHPLTRNW